MSNRPMTLYIILLCFGTDWNIINRQLLSLYYFCQGGYVSVICLFFCCAKTSKRICMKFSGKVGNWPLSKWLNFGGNPDHRLDTGIVFRICHYWEIQKVVLLLHPVIDSYWFARCGTDIATLVRRALVEVCTVPVLLVVNRYWVSTRFCLFKSYQSHDVYLHSILFI